MRINNADMNEVFQMLLYFFEQLSEGWPVVSDEQQTVSKLHHLEVPLEGLPYLVTCREDNTPLEYPIEEYPLQAQHGTRVLSDFEISRMDKYCQALLINLEQSGVLTPVTRELVLDQLLQLSPKEITPTNIQWIVLMVLDQQSDEFFSACIERLLVQANRNHLH